MAKKSSRPSAAKKSETTTKTSTKKASPKKAAKKKATKKKAASAKQEAPARAAAAKPSKKAAKKKAGKSAPAAKKASKKAAASTPAPAKKASAKKASSKTDVAAPTPAPAKKPSAKKASAKTDVAAPTPAPAKKSAKKASGKTDFAPPPAPTPAPTKKASKKAASKTDVAAPEPTPTPAPAAAPSKPAPKRATKKAATEPEPAADDDDDDGQTPAAARTGGGESPPPRVFRGFGRGLFEFLAELALNNDRSWFEAHKRRYESEVREPALAFVRAMGSRLTELSEHFIASAQKVGGSLMRIHRDTRFSPDKTPYKTNLGVQFRHSSGKDVHAPGLYVHVDTEGVFLASGTWHPEPEQLAAIRNAIVERPDAWQAARDNAGFREHWGLEGESLSRPPRGFDKLHPFVDDLRRKDHIAVCRLTPDEMMRPDMVDRITARFVASAPYLSFLCGAIGVSF